MTLTIGNWIFIGIIALFGLTFAIYCFSETEIAWGISTILVTIILCGVIAFGLSWWHTNTASGIRTMKDYESNMNNGLEREITITAEDGRLIFYYKGKCDIETNNDNYILFEGEDGRRRIIYYGVQDTALIEEIETEE